jgi:ferrochelatase
MTRIDEKADVKPVRAGLLLVNLGTPDAPERRPVARFLREFLSDPRVVDLPRILWLPLLYGVIVPLRAGRSAAAYREVWWDEGSPLLVLTRRLAKRLAEALAEDAMVEMGMRYGQPSIAGALERLQQAGVGRLVVLPLYPQFSHTTTSSIFDAVDAALERLDWRPQQVRIEDYHSQPLWVDAVAESISGFRSERGSAEKLLFSLHGIPERYVKQGDPYREQCERSVAAIVEKLGLEDDEWLLTYQSRVGREPWLQPYTDITVRSLGAKGVRRLQVVCPGFAVDCLETLEEIAMQNREFFEQAGGGELQYIPAMNDSPGHVSALASLVREYLGEELPPQPETAPA